MVRVEVSSVPNQPKGAAGNPRAEGAAELLNSAGLRATASRLEIFAHLLRQRRPLSHQEIMAKLPGYDRVTLYRTLNALTSAGLVHAVRGLEGVWRFCAHSPRHEGCPGNHPHFLCVDCGLMICLAGQRLPHVEVPPDVEVRGKQLLVYGRCERCARSERTGASPRSRQRKAAT